MRRISFMIGLGAMMSLCLAQAGRADLLFGVAGSNDSQTLYTINTSSGAETTLATITGLPTITPTYTIQGLTYDPTSGNLFATFGNNNNPTYLVEISLQSGTLGQVVADAQITESATGHGHNFWGLAFNSGTLYAIEPSEVYFEKITYNFTTPTYTATSAGVSTYTGGFVGHGLTGNFANTSSSFYGQINTSADTVTGASLYLISTSGALTSEGTLGVTINSMAYDSNVSSNIFALNSTYNLVTITPNPGGATTVSSAIGSNTFEALAFGPAALTAPEPATLLQTVSGVFAAGLFFLARRRIAI